MHEQHNLATPPGAGSPESVRAYATMNTLRALECLAFTALTTAELADSIQISVRTARRLLQRLALEGFVTQQRGHRGRYHATTRLAALGRQMLDHAPLARAAAPHVANLANDTASIAHLWIPGYDDHIVCAVHADGRTTHPAISLLHEIAPAPLSAAGTVLLRDRAHLRSSCYQHHATDPTFAAAVLHNGHVIAALAITSHDALDATATITTTATQLSNELDSRPQGPPTNYDDRSARGATTRQP
jgi:DNA-binding MarR family transcriptional regulator